MSFDPQLHITDEDQEKLDANRRPPRDRRFPQYDVVDGKVVRMPAPLPEEPDGGDEEAAAAGLPPVVEVDEAQVRRRLRHLSLRIIGLQETRQEIEAQLEQCTTQAEHLESVLGKL